MKNLFYFYFISALLFASCDEAISIDEEVITPPEEVIPTPIPDDKNTPSDYDFSTLQANDTLNIAYTHDLGGKSIEVPSNVVINYNKGEIVNGSLVFKEGKIDGNLLNHKLKIQGTPSLTSTTFKFEKSKWEITEGEVSDAIALVNKNTLKNVIAQVKSYGVETFKIDDLDACFWVDNELKDGRPMLEGSILLPSNFILEMTGNTHLRVQANHYFGYCLLEIRGVSNLTVKGGNLYGDRDQHDYSPVVINGHEYKTHEWGHLIDICTGVNIQINNVKLMDAAGDGLNIRSIKKTFDSDYIGSNNISVAECVFDSNRRNNLSITDGYDILIHNNTFLNAGIDTPLSKGTAPKLALDVEAVRGTNSNGEKIYYQRAYDITIRDNIEKGSAAGSFYVAIGEDITIENNTAENFIGFGSASGVKIKGNRITSLNNESSTTGIAGGRRGENASIYGNEISNNIVNGFNNGIRVSNSDVKVFGNEIDNCITGIYMRDLKNSNIYENKIKTNRSENCYGIFGFVGNINDVTIRNNEIEVDSKPIAFVNVNIESGHENNTVTVKDNDLKGGKVSISNSKGIVVE